MKKITLTLCAAIALVSNSAYAVFMDNSEMCSAQSSSITQSIKYTEITKASRALGEAAAAINAMEDEPAAFVIGVTAGSAVRIGQTAVNLSQDSAEYVEKVARYAAKTPACANSANNLADGIDCFVQLPNKVITLTLSTATELTGSIVVGVYSLGSGVLKASEQLSMSIAEELQSYDNVVTDLMSVPFVVVGVVLHVADFVAEVILVDTVGGGLLKVRNAVVTTGANVCDALSSLVHLRIDNTLGYVLETAADLIVDGFGLVKHILTLGGNLKPDADQSWPDTDYND